MAREVKVRRKVTREGPDYRLALYDERGRFVLTARVYALNLAVVEEIQNYLDTGSRTAFTQKAIRLPKDVEA
jgi:hypothetical protein